MTKRIFCILVVLSLALLTPVQAQTYNAGIINSDSHLWYLDLKMEELTESLMLTDDARVKLQLKHASERIGELKQTSNPEPVANEYVKTLNRINLANNLQYQTTVNVQEQLQEHNRVLSTTTPDGADNEHRIQSSQMIQELVRTQNSYKDQSTDMMNEESMWWSDKVAQYNIISIPSPIENHGTFEKYTSQLNDGVTVIDVVRSDNTLIQSFIIRKESGQVTIQTGTTENYVDKYTVTIEQLQNYEKLL